MISLDELTFLVSNVRSSPTLAEMPRRTLDDKGIAGATAAHVVEEVHTPLNLAYLSFTTGSSAFQNIVGVTYEEMPDRIRAGRLALERCGVLSGQHLVVTYAPLVNVFSKAGLVEHGATWSFLERSHRDALVLALCRDRPDAVIGESSFLCAGLVQAVEMGLQALLPEKLCLITAGTPLDLELPPIADRLGYRVHDLYGCQEFGWLFLDGVPLREDISLIASPRGGEYREVVVGGLPMGDSFPYSEGGHLCDPAGRLLTYKRLRTYPEYDVVVAATPRGAADLIQRTARSILRIKGRVVKVADDLWLGAPETELLLKWDEAGRPGGHVTSIRGPVLTALFDRLVDAQSAFQTNAKTDPTWLKRR